MYHRYAFHSFLSYFFFLKLSEWNLINEDGKLKLNRSLKVKSFLKGMELFELIAEVAEAEGILLSIFEIYDALFYCS